MSATELQKYDVVITTYQIVTKEHEMAVTGGAATKKRKTSDRALFDVKWKVHRGYQHAFDPVLTSSLSE